MKEKTLRERDALMSSDQDASRIASSFSDMSMILLLPLGCGIIDKTSVDISFRPSDQTGADAQDMR